MRSRCAGTTYTHTHTHTQQSQFSKNIPSPRKWGYPMGGSCSWLTGTLSQLGKNEDCCGIYELHVLFSGFNLPVHARKGAWGQGYLCLEVSMTKRKRDDGGHVGWTRSRLHLPGQGHAESISKPPRYTRACCDCNVITVLICMIRLDNNLILATLQMLLLTKDYFKSHKPHLQRSNRTWTWRSQLVSVDEAHVSITPLTREKVTETGLSQTPDSSD